MLPGHVLGATGAGDVKLMAAVGAIVGPPLVVKAFLFTARRGRRARGRRGRAAPPAARHAGRDGTDDCGASRRAQEIRAATRASRFAYGPAIAIGSVLAALMRIER